MPNSRCLATRDTVCGAGFVCPATVTEPRSDNKAVELLAHTAGLAEAYPEDKYLVVQHRQALGHVAGMTRDGLNDAPTGRQAEFGIAVSTATGVSKRAASVASSTSGRTNNVALAEQGRTSYALFARRVVNGALMVALINWRVPRSGAQPEPGGAGLREAVADQVTAVALHSVAANPELRRALRRA